MKHTKKKRLLAIVLCMILVLSTGIAAFANENVGLQSVACQAATLERVIKNMEKRKQPDRWQTACCIPSRITTCCI